MPMPIPKPFLADYFNSVFIETGSHHGNGIQAALDAGFDCIYSVELNSFDFGWCCHRFQKQRTKVHLLHEDSRAFLRRFLPDVTTKTTFWLDAHECGSGAGNEKDCPLLEELELIATHPIKEHTILIDDVRLFGRQSFPTRKEVRKVLLRINGVYNIYLTDSEDFTDDILVARI